MSLIAAYKKFRTDLRGWVPITFDEFRTFFEPLCRRSTWSSADSARLRTFAESGGAHALRNLYGKGKTTKPLIDAILGSTGMEPESMTREELDTQMRFLIDNCLRDEWNPKTFISFGEYLNSDKGPESLVASTVTPSSSSMFQSGQSPGPAAPVPASQSAGAKVPERDLFAEKYRSACKAFQTSVQTHLRDGARRAGLRIQETEKIAAAATELSQEADTDKPTTAADIVAYAAAAADTDDDTCSSDLLAAFRAAPAAKGSGTTDS